MRHGKLQDAHPQEGASKAERARQHAFGLGHRPVPHHQQINQKQVEQRHQAQGDELHIDEQAWPHRSPSDARHSPERR